MTPRGAVNKELKRSHTELVKMVKKSFGVAIQKVWLNIANVGQK